MPAAVSTPTHRLTIDADPLPVSVYHDDAYLAAASLLYTDGCLEVFRYGSAVIPLIVKPLPQLCGSGFDAVSPYDFSGPQLNGEAARDVWHALTSWCRKRDIITGFFRFHPFAGEAEAWRGMDGLDIVHSADNVVIHLTDADSVLVECKPNVRRYLNIARRAGVMCELAPVGAAGLDEFVPLYRRTMERNGADSFYLFGRPFFDALAAGLGKYCLLALARMDGVAVAGILVVLDGSTAFYYLAATSELGRRPRVRAAYMLVHETARRLCTGGIARFHLGGGAPGLAAFKARFGPGRVPFFVGRAVFDPARYAGLSEGVADTFFPAYRAPRLQ